MENQEINRIVKDTKTKYKAGIIKYLTQQVSNCTAALTKDERGKYSKRGVQILKELLNTRIRALHHVEHLPTSQYDHNDWAQCMNVTNMFYQMAKRSANPSANVKIAKAHFNYCCRYYIRTAPQGKQDECLQTINDLNKWNQTPGAEMKFAAMAMRKHFK